MKLISFEKFAQARSEPSHQVGDLIVEYLRQLDVDYVFGIPGGAIEPFYDAMARGLKRRGPQPVVARHETGAAFMADGYARNSGKLGVCCATTGPGATNLITGVASAYENHIPMLVITAQTALNTFGSGAFQESSCTGTNTVGMFEHCARYSSLVSHVEQVERKLTAAVMTAFHAPQGPVHLSIPVDIFRAPAAHSTPSYDLANLVWTPALIDQEAVDLLCQELGRGGEFVFVIGADCNEAIGTILDVALLLDAKIVTTPHGKGLVSPYHPQFRGVIGFAGHASAGETVGRPEVDAIIAVGTPLSEFATDGWNPRLLDERLIHVESADANLTRSPMAHLHVRGQISCIFKQLLDYLDARSASGGRPAGDSSALRGRQVEEQTAQRRIHFELDEKDKYIDDTSPVKPQRLMRELARMFPPNTRYLADTGASFAWAIHYLHPYDRRIAGARNARGGVFRACLEFASMGWAIGASVGTALARPGQPVVCITGDGSMLMSGQEITVAVQLGLPVIFVILNDRALGMVKHGQRLNGAEPVGFELPEVNFADMARSLGAVGHEVRSPAELDALDVQEMCNRPGPTLLDVYIDPEEVPPLGTRVKGLQAHD